MLIKNVGAFLGRDLDYVPRTDIAISRGTFSQIGYSLRAGPKEESADCDGLIALPGFVNCHTHIGDSIAKDIFLDGTVNKKIHPVFGIKPKILKNTAQDQLKSFMRNSCYSMMCKGITTFADFREGGIEGAEMLRQAVSDIPIRPIILGRLELYHGTEQIRQNSYFPRKKVAEMDRLLRCCDGLGISGANENSAAVLRRYSRTPKLRAIHCSETEQSVSTSLQTTSLSETARALYLRPHFMVHMTHASKEDLDTAARRSVGIVVCPRANAALAEGIPDVGLMLKSGCTVALGTDNVMINSHDMFREMDYVWKSTMGIHKKRMEPREVLKMATVNGGAILRKNIGVIGQGMLADCIFLEKHAVDLEPIHDPHASIVHRAGESSIRAVMIGGRIVHGRL